MSKMGQHYQEVQGTAAYRTGFRAETERAAIKRAADNGETM